MQFSRTVSSETSRGPALISLMQQYKWTKCVMLTNTYYFDGGLDLAKQLQTADIEVFKPVAFESGYFTAALLSQIKHSGIRIIVFMAEDNDVASVSSMTAAGWSWIMPEQRDAAVASLQGWLFLRAFLSSQDMQAFAEQVSNYTKTFFQPPSAAQCQDRNGTSEHGTTCAESRPFCDTNGINWHQPEMSNAQACPVTCGTCVWWVIPAGADAVDLTYSVALHDAIMLFAHAATKLLSEGGDLHDGQAVTEAVRNTNFVGAGGEVVALDERGDRRESYEVMNFVIGNASLEYKGKTFRALATGLQLQEYYGGYKFCSKYSEVTPTIKNSVDACKDTCVQQGCWALTYYAGLQTEFKRRCYLYMSKAECGTLEGYKDGVGSVWSVPVGVFNSSTGQYQAYKQAVIWPGGTPEVPTDYISGVLRLMHDHAANYS